MNRILVRGRFSSLSLMILLTYGAPISIPFQSHCCRLGLATVTAVDPRRLGLATVTAVDPLNGTLPSIECFLACLRDCLLACGPANPPSLAIGSGARRLPADLALLALICHARSAPQDTVKDTIRRQAAQPCTVGARQAGPLAVARQVLLLMHRLPRVLHRDLATLAERRNRGGRPAGPNPRARRQTPIPRPQPTFCRRRRPLCHLWGAAGGGTQFDTCPCTCPCTSAVRELLARVASAPQVAVKAGRRCGRGGRLTASFPLAASAPQPPRCRRRRPPVPPSGRRRRRHSHPFVLWSGPSTSCSIWTS